jgi:predicted N-acyltransferase
LLKDASTSVAGLRLSFIDSLSSLAADDWDTLFEGYSPFVRYAYLAALERYGCVGSETGWRPFHLIATDDTGQLVGAVPLYLKAHSYGEFVFDFGWADASRRLGEPYYPKLLNAIPFTPSVGPRIGAVSAAVRTVLVDTLKQQLNELGVSSVHGLFAADTDASAFADSGWLQRTDLQFQWFNQGDTDFAGFVSRLAGDKRKKILRERRRVAEAGIHFECRPGDALSESEWMSVYALYANTYEERGQAPYLTPEFLLDYGGTAGTPMRVILAYEGPRLVAAALTLQAGDTLYGRHWGAADHYHSLHFECCYYQGIELCLRQGLQRYDAGTQGEHKLARGFTPVVTRSFHLLRNPRLHSAVEDFLMRERQLVEARRRELMQHSPYRQLTPL